MKIIIMPAVGINYYPAGEMVVRNCTVIQRDRFEAMVNIRYGFEHKGQTLPSKFKPEDIKNAIATVKACYRSNDFFVVPESISELFELHPSEYIPAFSELRNIWIPESWKK